MISYAQLVRYPGNQALFEAIEMCVLSTLCGRPLHLHAEGLRGTGKTTIMRAARHLLPPILRVRGCPYNCHPSRPHCPLHRGMKREELAALGTEWVPMPFLEISHSAKMGTVVGSIDLSRLTARDKPDAALLPGTIPQAHRGVIFIDEINRLAETSPELTDVLLGVMGTKPGRIQIEETGLPVACIEVNAGVWAASNPDEDPGPLEDIRRQLADRFDLVVSMGRPAASEAVRAVLEASDAYFVQQLAGSRGGEAGTDLPVGATLAVGAAVPALEGNREHWQPLLQTVPHVTVPDTLRSLVASLYVDFGLESLRAVEAWQLAARMHAALAGRKETDASDFVAVAPMVLRHRVEMSTLSEVMARLDQPGSTTGPTSENQEGAQVPAGASAQQGEGGLANLFARARERLHSLMNGERAGDGSEGGRGSRQGTRGGRGAGGSAPVTDPMRLPLVAPPALARPLPELPAATWVREE